MRKKIFTFLLALAASVGMSWAASNGKLPGAFSVSPTKVVYFSQGNLQATTNDLGATWTWGFAEHQWDYIGGRKYEEDSDPQTGNNFINGNGTVSENGTVDLFGWSTTATYYGIHYITSDANLYPNNFVDWGNAIGGDWYTLSSAEWTYLFSGRANAANLRGQAKVNGKNGYIFLPDDWTIPSGLEFNPNPGLYYFNTYSGDNWTAMENAGAVFLPASGYRYGTEVSSLDNNGYYWSSTFVSSPYYPKAGRFYFNENKGQVTDDTSWSGQAVRLVSGTPPTPANPSGSCGENLTWEFNTETGALTISGTGAMTSAPWGTYKEDITSLSLPDGLTAIPSEAFIGCSGLTTVTIPASVTSIGADAFRYCTSVTDVYCYPKAADLDWNDYYKDDFIEDHMVTRCHVYADEFDGYMDKYADADGVNVTFVNDLNAIAVNTNEDPQHAGVYYSTYYNSAKKYILPAGCEAYTALLSGDVLTLAKIAEGGQVIPNGAAVILKSESASVSILPTETEAVAYNAENNSLQGRDAETALSTLGLTRETCYVLSGTTEHGVGFYHPNSDNLIAHKAYVPMAANTQSGAPRRLRFVFADEKTTTGVENVQGNDVQCTKVIENGVLVIIKNGVRYNAQGQIVK